MANWLIDTADDGVTQVQDPSRRGFLGSALLGTAGLVAAGAASGVKAQAAADRKPAAQIDRLDRFRATALQVNCEAVKNDNRETARARMRASIARIDGLIGGGGAIGSSASSPTARANWRLVVLPEYVLTGFPTHESIAEWTDKASLAPDGPEYEALAKIAQSKKIFLAGNSYETDRHFPGIYFQGSWMFDPDGNRVLSYRRLISIYTPSPRDVWDLYLDKYGLEGVFPVADTAIGKVSAIASEEILYPEVARCHAIRGAEVMVHSSSEAVSPQITQKQIARRARALENLVYVVSANNAELRNMDISVDGTNGYSDIIDYLGNQVVQAGQGETGASAWLDMAGLRAARRRPEMGNMLARQALDIFSDSYANADLGRRNGMLKGGKVQIPERSYFLQRQMEVMERMKARGIIL